VVKNDIKRIIDYDSFFDFLSHPKKGGIILSERAKEEFIEELKSANQEINFTSPKFIEHMEKLMSLKASGLKEQLKGEDLIFDTLPPDNIIENLKTQEINRHLHLIELFKAKHHTTKYNILAQIKDAKGDYIPTMGISNMISQVNMILEQTPKHFFKDNPTLLSGIETLLEIESKKDSIAVNELNSDELLKLSLVKHYIMSSINENTMFVQPWNFSDKPSIYALKINTLATLDGVKSFSDFTATELQELFYREQQKYYNEVTSAVLLDFKTLDPSFFRNYQKNNRMTSAVEKIKAIEAYLNTIKNENELSARIQEAFNDGTAHFEITKNLHYAVYGGKIKFNQHLKATVQIFNNKNLFKKYVQQKENSLLEALPTVLGREIVISGKKRKEAIANHFNMPIDEVFTENNVLNLTKDKKLNEISARYLWSRNLIISQFTNITVKDSYLHDLKTDFKEIDLSTDEGWEQFIVEESGRTTTFTKRMNMPGASMTPYGKGPEGISPVIKIAVIEEPKAPTFNYTGTEHSQAVMDGGAEVNAFFNNMLISSLPGLNLQKTQKPIGESIQRHSSAMLKFATFAITNEKVRKGMFGPRPSYMAMKKLNSIDLYDGEYKNILEVDGVELDLLAISPNLYIPIDNMYYKLNSMKWVQGTNKYIQELSWGNRTITREVIVNNLFDLWEAFGGAFSAEPDETTTEDRYKSTEGSIDLVSAIIRLHSLAQTSFNLKDKMISMAVPPSAVKQGVANINNLDSFYNSDDSPAFFNFDTTHFGVQLSAYHTTDNSSTNEITQALSATSQNAADLDTSNAIFQAVSSLIEGALKKFNIQLSKKSGVDNLTRRFITHINKSEQINNSRLIINGIISETDVDIPFGNKTIYKQFISYVVSNINVDFIRRTFAGSGSVLNPSHGIVGIFENINGKTYFAEDILTLYNKRKWDEKQELEEYLSKTHNSEFVNRKERIL
jgi:hypothetical protein